MTDFLLFLGKLNLALGGAIIVIWLLRRPLRALFGAAIAYAIWLLVPVAGLASLLPPRVAAPLSAHLPLQTPAGAYPAAPVLGQIVHPALRLTEQLTQQTALMPPVIAARAVALAYGPPDYATLFFAAWALGALAMTLYLARSQIRFHTDMRLGEAGPAVLGFLRPHIVMPDAFQTQYTAPEQAAILAHERVHLARQDARINALAALLRCLCWFNPLVHLGAAWLRLDQELACDAAALAGPVSRRAYAHALLKSQMIGTALPLGCNWPGSEHPLVERIALLKRKRPGTARRVTGTLFVMAAAAFVGLSAWAAQPGMPAKFVAPLTRQMAMATPQPESPAVGRPATTAADDDYVIPRRIASIRTIKLPRLSFLAPVMTAMADLPPAQASEPPAPAPMPVHVASVVAEKLAALNAPDVEYPAPVLKLNASLLLDEWSVGQIINYCKDFAFQTVTQGANIPMAVDESVKRRLAFFYSHCVQNNNSWSTTYGDGGPATPAYSAIGAASAQHPAAAAGAWTIAFPSGLPFLSQGVQAYAQSCVFTQVGNILSGSCTGRMGTGAASGVVDGRQVRWAWKYAPDERPDASEVDFIGMVGPDGAVTGQAVNAETGRLESFTATPAPAQVALRN